MVCGSYWCVTDSLRLGTQKFLAFLNSLVGQNIQNGQCQQWCNCVEYQGYTVNIELLGRNGLCIRGHPSMRDGVPRSGMLLYLHLILK